MFTVLLFKEMREHMLTFRFGAAMVTMFALILFSSWVIGGDYQEKLAEFQRLEDQFRQEINTLEVPSLLRPTIGYLPPPLSVFSQAESKLFGNFVEINKNVVPVEANIHLTNNELLESAMSIDVLSVIAIVLSLFAILLSYDAISGEREQGTLKLMISYPSGRSSVFMSKYCGILVVLLVPFIVSLLSAIILLKFIFSLNFGLSDWMAMLLMMLAVVAYTAVFTGLGLLTSAALKNSATSVVASLLLWSVFVFIMPLAAARFSETIVNLRPQDEIKRLKEKSLEETRKRVDQFDDQVLAELNSDNYSIYGGSVDSSGYNASFMFDASPDLFKRVSRVFEYAHPLWLERANNIWDLEQNHAAVEKEQAELAGLFSVLSPTYHLRAAFTQLTGTSYDQYNDFLDKARDYRIQFINNFESKGYFSDKVTLYVSRLAPERAFSESDLQKRLVEAREQRKSAKFRSLRGHEKYALYGDLPDDLMPEFNYEADNIDFSAITYHIALLYVMSILLITWGVFSFNRYDVR